MIMVRVPHTHKNLGAVHNNGGAMQEAKECYDHASAIYIKNFGPEDDQVRLVQDALARLQQEREKKHNS